MIDPITERRYSDVRELMDLWRRYHDFFKVAVAGKDITPEMEHEFITVKSRIAMLHDIFMDCLEHDQNIGQNVLSIVTRSITLKHVHRMSTAEIKKIELEWHESYLLLNETIGLLEDKRRRFAEISQSEYYRSEMKKKITAQVKQFLHSWVFKALIVVVVLTVGVFFAAQYDVMDRLFQNPRTRSFITKWEDIIRAMFKDYPFRDLSVFTRKDTLLATGVALGNMQAHEDPKYAPNVGVDRVRERVGGSQWDFTEALKEFVECRAETYTTQMGLYGGGDCVIWIYRMPSSAKAKPIDDKFQSWLNAVGLQQTDRDWEVFRNANVLCVTVGNPAIRNWLKQQYGRGKKK